MIAQAIARIMKKVGGVAKTGTNQGEDAWNYATIEDVLTKVQPLLAEEGLIPLQSEIDQGLYLDEALLKITYRFALLHTSGAILDSIDGEPICHTGMCSVIDTHGAIDDKAANKCHTAARKYFILALFQIPTSKIDDADREPNQRRRQAPAKQEAKPAAEKKKAEPLKIEYSTPKLLPAPAGKEDVLQWGMNFAAHLRTAKTGGERDQWWHVNTIALDDISLNYPDIFKKIQGVDHEMDAKFKAEKAAA